MNDDFMAMQNHLDNMLPTEVLGVKLSSSNLHLLTSFLAASRFKTSEVTSFQILHHQEHRVWRQVELCPGKFRLERFLGSAAQKPGAIVSSPIYSLRFEHIYIHIHTSMLLNIYIHTYRYIYTYIHTYTYRHTHPP